jgi:hypothetical protein
MFVFLCRSKIKDATVVREMYNNSMTVLWHSASAGDGRKITIKLWYTSTKLHGVIPKKTALFTVNATNS